MHLLGQHETWDGSLLHPAMTTSEDRRAANRAVGFSAVGLLVTGLAELAMALPQATQACRS